MDTITDICTKEVLTPTSPKQQPEKIPDKLIAMIAQVFADSKTLLRAIRGQKSNSFFIEHLPYQTQIIPALKGMLATIKIATTYVNPEFIYLYWATMNTLLNTIQAQLNSRVGVRISTRATPANGPCIPYISRPSANKHFKSPAMQAESLVALLVLLKQLNGQEHVAQLA